MRLIFSLNPGRCGTAYLWHAFETVPGVMGGHEPRPNFVDVARAAQGNPAEARRWLEEVKLPYIQSLDCAVYAETSHLFIQGFVEALLDLGVVPDVIVIHRPVREVALSMWRRKEIPGRTELGLRYRLKPDDPGVLLPVENYSAWMNYKLCVWHAWEVRLRIRKYGPMLRDAGARIVEIQTGELSDGLPALLEELGLPGPDMEKFQPMRYQRPSATPEGEQGLWPMEDLPTSEGEIEEMVADRIAEYAALL
jgi:hypothetical protein